MTDPSPIEMQMLLIINFGIKKVFCTPLPVIVTTPSNGLQQTNAACSIFYITAARWEVVVSERYGSKDSVSNMANKTKRRHSCCKIKLCSLCYQGRVVFIKKSVESQIDRHAHFPLSECLLSFYPGVSCSPSSASFPSPSVYLFLQDSSSCCFICSSVSRGWIAENKFAPCFGSTVAGVLPYCRKSNFHCYVKKPSTMAAWSN